MLFLESFESYQKLPIIFVGGLDYRRSDWSLPKQIKALETYLPGRQITTFCSSKTDKCGKHNDRTKNDAKNFLKSNPNSIVLLFSGGTGISTDCAKLIKNKKNLFILEPYPQARDTVFGAVELGVPQMNVILGNGEGRGLRFMSGIPRHTKTPNNLGHFESILFASEMISKLGI